MDFFPPKEREGQRQLQIVELICYLGSHQTGNQSAQSLSLQCLYAQHHALAYLRHGIGVCQRTGIFQEYIHDRIQRQISDDRCEYGDSLFPSFAIP